jgi:hypothetical protein
MMIVWLFVLVLLAGCQQVRAFASRSVVLPLINNDADAEAVKEAFESIVESTDAFVSSPDKSESLCSVPAFGDVVITVACDAEDQFVLTVSGASASDFGWICSRILTFQDRFGDLLDTSLLRQRVADYHNARPPDPGRKAVPSGISYLDKVLSPDLLSKLETDGYVVVDTSVTTSPESIKKLSKYLTSETNQGDDVRRDRVAFLSREDADDCDVDFQFDFLMGIAFKLNQGINMKDSPYDPIPPGTSSEPLTNPSDIQAAEYGEGDFYVVHR